MIYTHVLNAAPPASAAPSTAELPPHRSRIWPRGHCTNWIRRRAARLVERVAEEC